jgi:sulfur-carrier protein
VITLVYLARLRETLGTPSEKLQLPHEVGTVATLLAWLRARGGAWAAELAPGRAVRVAVNFAVAKADTPIKAGDEIALFPPVTGG